MQWRFVTGLAEITINIDLLKMYTLITTGSIYVNSGSFIVIRGFFYCYRCPLP